MSPIFVRWANAKNTSALFVATALVMLACTSKTTHSVVSVALDEPATPTEAAPAATTAVADETVVDVPTNAASVRQLVIEAETAALGRRQPEAFIRLLASDLKATASRNSTRSRFDTQMTRARIAVIYRAALRHSEGRNRVAFLNQKSQVIPPSSTGSAGPSRRWVARVEHDVVFTNPDTNQRTTALHEKIELEVRNNQWLMTKFHYWPLLPESLEEYPQSYWDGQDADVENSKRNNDDRQLAYALMSGYRFDECAVVARRITAQSPTDAWAWDMRTTASYMVGDEKDSDFAAMKAKRIRAGQP